MNAEVDFEAVFEDSEAKGFVETQEAVAKINEIKRLLRIDAEFFIEFFLADQLESEVPEFHKEVWGLLTNQEKERILLAIPRGHNKTTMAKLAILWHFLFSPHRFCVYASGTNGLALNACKDIMGYLKNPNFIAVFGGIEIVKASETESLWVFKVNLGEGRFKTCILRALGAGQQVRGLNVDNQRPDLTVVDDLEDLDNTGSEVLQKKLDRWVFGSFLKALAKRRKVIWLGNMLAKTSLLARLSRNPQWNPVVYGAIIKDAVTGLLEPLWPWLWSIDELMSNFREERDLGQTESWMCEMMNMPGHGVNGFNAQSFNYKVVPMMDEIQAAWLCLDPAFGEKATSDKSSITVHVLPRDGCPMVVEHITGKMDESEILENMTNLATKWNAWVWGIESVAAQRVLITLFKVLLVMKGLESKVEIIPLMAGSGDPKIGRIKAFVSLMRAGEYAIPEYDIDITTQFLSYNMKKKSNDDDLIDSCAYGPQMLDLYLPILVAQFNNTLNQPCVGIYGSEVEGV